MKKIKVSRGDLYRYCSDMGLMLSWGISLQKILVEMETCQDNQFLKAVSAELSEEIMKGSCLEEVFQKYPSVFKPVFIKWIRAGERFGILDHACLQMAGLMRFDYLLVKKDGEVYSEDLGNFLLRLAEFFQNQALKKSVEKSFKNEEELNKNIVPSLETLTENAVIRECFGKIQGRKSEGKLFGNSIRNYNADLFYRKIANPLFWHLLETAEENGYLVFMLEILGHYLMDKNNLLPSEAPVELKERSLKDSENSMFLAGKLLQIIEESSEKKALITIKNDAYDIFIDGKRSGLITILTLPAEKEKLCYSIISSLKFIFDTDVAEKRLSQKAKTDLMLNNKNYIASIDISPPYPLLEGEKNVYEAMCREVTGGREGVEKIEIRLQRE